VAHLDPTAASSGVILSVVITTFNRAEALRETLDALGHQELPHDRYEVVVVDDGSTDHTAAVLSAYDAPYRLKTVRHPENRGVSAGRNSGIRLASGGFLVFVSDDVIVPPAFLARHVETLERFPGSWVVGKFRQRSAVTNSPFARYLDELERSFQRGRTARAIAPDIFEMTWPTARNLSLPRDDLERIGLFDERFRTCCEDQDLAERARVTGTRFLYDTQLDCIHNDQSGDLDRYCAFQERGARDTPLLCAKYPDLHGRSSLAIENGPASPQDSVRLRCKKAVKALFATQHGRRAVRALIAVGERVGAPEWLLRRGYSFAIGLAIFRGWRDGTARLGPGELN
jgi:GT2 family glycosyltransferase